MVNVITVTFSYILVIVFLLSFNIGASPCFHCTVLVHVAQLLVSVTGYILPICIMQVLLVSV